MKQTLPRKQFHLRGCIGIWFELLLGYANLTVTGAGAYVVIRGNVEWRDAQKRLAAAGYSLDMQEIVKAAVPDAENFGATPALKVRVWKRRHLHFFRWQGTKYHEQPESTLVPGLNAAWIERFAEHETTSDMLREFKLLL